MGGQVGTAGALWSVMQSCGPDVVVFDLHLSGVADLSFISQIGERWPAVKVVAMPPSENQSLVNAALTAGKVIPP